MDGDERYDPLKYHREAVSTEAPDKATLLPSLNSPYKAASTVDGEVPRLVAILGKDGFRLGSVAYITLQYVHIGCGDFGFTASGQVFRFVFSDIQPKLLTVHGRNLLRIYHHIGLRRMPWIRMTDRDFRLVGDGADEPVITSIEVSDWKPEPDRQSALPLATEA